MYIAVAILAVPQSNQSLYQKAAEFMANWSIDHGALEVMELIEAHVPDGEKTDLRKAVAAEEGEQIVAGWVIWPDKQTLDKAKDAMAAGEGFGGYPEGGPPFDGSRLIFGEFTPILTRGRT